MNCSVTSPGLQGKVKMSRMKRYSGIGKVHMEIYMSHSYCLSYCG